MQDCMVPKGKLLQCFLVVISSLGGILSTDRKRAARIQPTGSTTQQFPFGTLTSESRPETAMGPLRQPSSPGEHGLGVCRCGSAAWASQNSACEITGVKVHKESEWHIPLAYTIIHSGASPPSQNSG